MTSWCFKKKTEKAKPKYAYSSFQCSPTYKGKLLCLDETKIRMGYCWNATGKGKQKIFEKFSDIKFHENPSNGSHIVPCEKTNGQTDMTKLIVAFRNFEKARKMARNEQHRLLISLTAQYWLLTCCYCHCVLIKLISLLKVCCSHIVYSCLLRLTLCTF
jgi:hypothetical protein